MAALDLSFQREIDQILFQGTSSVKMVILNRSKKLNSLNYEMVTEMNRFLKLYQNDPTIQLIILKGNGRAFCAGGDLMAVMALSLLGDWTFVAEFYKRELELDYLIATYKKPVVCLIDGIVMGAGAGLSMNATFRIVTEKAVFAMPEASIGFYPDVGASYFLSRLPGYFGEYLGLTGATLNGAEMVACGLATHFICSKVFAMPEASIGFYPDVGGGSIEQNPDIALLEHELLAAATPSLSTLDAIVDKFTQKPYALKEDSPFKRLETINKCFSKQTVEQILLSLEHEMKIREEKWIVQALNSMNSSSPLSLKITLRSIQEGRMQNLGQCLFREYATSLHLLNRRVSNDFYEGCRVILSKKDDKQKWEPSKLELVTQEMVDAHFTRLDDEDHKPFKIPAETSELVNKLRTRL